MPNKPIFSPKTSLYKSLLEDIARNTQFLLDNDLFDENTYGPKAGEIERKIYPYYYEHHAEELPPVIKSAIWRALYTGVACEALGDLQAALAWYRIGQHEYRNDWLAGECYAHTQESAGICATLAGNTARAHDLLTWAAQNRLYAYGDHPMTADEIRELEKERNYQTIWQALGFCIFNLCWLGNWQEVLRLSEIGQKAIEKTRRAGHPKDFREPQLLISIGRALALYFLNPTEDGKLTAVNSLRVDKMPDRITSTRSYMLRYLFALSRKYREINPYEVSNSLSAFHVITITNKKLKESDFQAALDEILEEARRRGRGFSSYFHEVSSVYVHLRAGGYPSPKNQMDLCREVMLKNLPGNKKEFVGPSDDGIISATYATGKKW